MCVVQVMHDSAWTSNTRDFVSTCAQWQPEVVGVEDKRHEVHHHEVGLTLGYGVFWMHI